VNATWWNHGDDKEDRQKPHIFLGDEQSNMAAPSAMKWCGCHRPAPGKEVNSDNQHVSIPAHDINSLPLDTPQPWWRSLDCHTENGGHASIATVDVQL
jgi:hypothetical protein